MAIKLTETLIKNKDGTWREVSLIEQKTIQLKDIINNILFKGGIKVKGEVI